MPFTSNVFAAAAGRIVRMNTLRLERKVQELQRACVAATEAEAVAARVPLESYINAHATGNPEYIRKAFFPDAKIMAYRDGKLLNLSVEEFASRFGGKPAADESQRKRRIDSLDITGNAGVARIVLDYPDATLTDYMSLLKVDGEWKTLEKSITLR